MQCINPCRDIRHHAISALQRSLLSLEFASKDGKEWSAIFDEVLFPLILRLLKPEVYHSDPVGMSETRVQAATLVCKIFLRYLDQLFSWGGMLDLWLKILDILDRMINSGQSDSLVRTLRSSCHKFYSQRVQEEAIPESVKNILLVMADSGYLTPPPTQDPSKEKIWIETRKRLDRFLPNLFTEIFPPFKSPDQPATVTVQGASDRTPTSNGNEPSDVQSESRPSESTPDTSSGGSDDVD
jgi:brefeldin A-resistance guanine nucleotide exchange factor 1